MTLEKMINRIDKLEQKLTKGPWGSGFSDEALMVWSDSLAGRIVARCNRQEDAASIAESRNLLPELASALRAAREELAGERERAEKAERERDEARRALEELRIRMEFLVASELPDAVDVLEEVTDSIDRNDCVRLLRGIIAKYGGPKE